MSSNWLETTPGTPPSPGTDPVRRQFWPSVAVSTNRRAICCSFPEKSLVAGAYVQREELCQTCGSSYPPLRARAHDRAIAAAIRRPFQGFSHGLRFDFHTFVHLSGTNSM